MFASLNIIGNLASDAVEKNGWIVFRVGCRPLPKEDTVWITCRTKFQWVSALVKGQKVMVYGTPTFKIWESNSGPKMDITLFANNIVNLSPREKETTEVLTNTHSVSDEDDDVPF